MHCHGLCSCCGKRWDSGEVLGSSWSCLGGRYGSIGGFHLFLMALYLLQNQRLSPLILDRMQDKGNKISRVVWLALWLLQLRSWNPIEQFKGHIRTQLGFPEVEHNTLRNWCVDTTFGSPYPALSFKCMVWWFVLSHLTEGQEPGLGDTGGQCWGRTSIHNNLNI